MPFVQQLKPGHAFSVDLTHVTMENFSLNEQYTKQATKTAVRVRQLVQIPLSQRGGCIRLLLPINWPILND